MTKGARLGADIYNEKAMLHEYLYGSGDIHSLVAKGCFPEELENIEIKDIKKLRPDLRTKAKAPEFACQFGGGANAIQGSLSCSMEQAEIIEKNYYTMFSGIAEFKNKGSKFVRENGYVLICSITGHKIYWYDHQEWLERQKSFTPEFWDRYRELKKINPQHPTIKIVSYHFKAASKWDRMALNSCTQGSGIAILKYAMYLFFKWILENNLFGKVLIVNLVHDEACIEFPETISEAANKLQECMEKSASVFCKKLPIPAIPEVGTHWIH